MEMQQRASCFVVRIANDDVGSRGHVCDVGDARDRGVAQFVGHVAKSGGENGHRVAAPTHPERQVAREHLGSRAMHEVAHRDQDAQRWRRHGVRRLAANRLSICRTS